ncbi:MAG: CheY-like chemotaxis protein/Flp pilus assembly protein TadD [Pseudohongiellaceae bacterium]
MAAVSNRPLNTTPRIDYASKYVLVVDDFAQHLDFMSKALKAIGFTKIALANNPKEATSLCHEASFDIILCDYNMGEGKNGQQLLHELRHFKSVRHDCIFIMVTAETSREVVLGALESEPEGYIAKPFNQAVLRRKIDRVLDKQMCLGDIHLAIEYENYEEAISLCLDTAALHPRHSSWCQKTAAELHLRLGQYQQAKRTYEAVLEKRVLDWALLGLARALIYLEEYKEAINELQQVLILNNNCVSAFDLLAECYQHLKEVNLVQEHLTHAVKLSPFSVERQNTLGDVCLTNGDFESACKAYRNALKSAKFSIKEDPERYYKLAGAITDSMAGDMSQFDSTKVIEAHRVFADLEERLDPGKESEIRKDLINVRLFLNQQKPRHALDLMQELEQGLISNPDNLSAVTLVELAHSLLSLGDEVKAKKLLVHLLEREDLSLSQKNHAKTLLGNFEAEELAGRARELNEDAARLYKVDNLEASIKLFSEAVRLSPKSVVLNLNLAQAMVRVMETEKITSDYKKRSQACLATVGELDETSRHFSRYSNLVERFKELSTPASRPN